MANEMDRVVPLDELDDFQVAEGDPDIRGWEVCAADGRRIGAVDNLLVDTSAMKVRYLDVDLDEELLGTTNEDRHILVPIGYARLDEEDDRVLVDGIERNELTAIPAYEHEPVTREYETSLRRHFEPEYSAGESDFYHGDVYDSERFYEPRRSSAGSEGMEEDIRRERAADGRSDDADVRRDMR